MFKFSVNIFLFIAISLSSFSQAGIITNLTQVELDNSNFVNAEDKLTDDLLNINFITFGNWDFVWASPVNIADYYSDNTLYTPDVQKNWDFAENHSDALNILMNVLTVDDFYDDINNRYIQGTQFFNTDFHYVDNDDFGNRASQFTAQDNPFRGFYEQYETFFVRAVANRPSQESASVPEPATLLIFSFALIALSLRSRFVK